MEDIRENDYEVENAKKLFGEILEEYNSKDPVKIIKSKEKAITFLNKLCYSIAKTHFYEYIPEHISELMQEGAIGILKGLKKYKIEFLK